MLSLFKIRAKNKKPLTILEGERKVDVTIEPRLGSIPGIHKVNHMESNFAFSISMCYGLNYISPKGMLASFLIPGTCEWDLIWK